MSRAFRAVLSLFAVACTSTSFAQTSSYDGYVTRASAGADGTFIVSMNRPVSESAIEVARVRSDGVPIGQGFQIARSDSFSYWAHAAAANANGDAVVAWTSDDNRVLAQRFDRTVSPRGDVFEVASQGAYYYAETGMGRDGGFVVVWTPSMYQSAIKARLYDAAGNALGGETTVAQGRNNKPALAVGDDGGFVLVWQDNVALVGRRFDPTARAVGMQFRVDSDEQRGFLPSMGMAADGSFAVVWQVADSLDVFARRFDAEGHQLGGAIEINRGDGLPLHGTTAAMTPDGDFYVFWRCCRDEEKIRVLGQRVDRSGRRVGPLLQPGFPGLPGPPGAAISGSVLLVAFNLIVPDAPESSGPFAHAYDISATTGSNGNGDEDGDGVRNGADNCPTVANAGQIDDNGDGFGDDCVSPDVVIAVTVSLGERPVIGAGSTLLGGVTVGNDVRLGEHVRVEAQVKIGDRFTAGDFVSLGRRTTIGDDVAIGFATRIDATVRIGTGVTVADRVVIRRNVTIGDDVTIESFGVVLAGARIGAGATLETGARIGRGATVKPGAMVPAGASVPPGVVYP